MARSGVRESATTNEKPRGRSVRAVRAAANRDEPVRQRLLAEATRLFAEKGFESTSVQEIVSAAGVTKGAMYHYFDSKDDLLHEIYGRLLRMQTERLDKFAMASGPIADRVYAAAADVIETTVENLDDSKIFFQSIHQLAPETRKAVRAERRRYHERFRDLVIEGQRAHVFRDDVPPDLAVDFFFGSVHHLGTWYRADGPLSGAEIGRHFADLLLASLRP